MFLSAISGWHSYRRTFGLATCIALILLLNVSFAGQVEAADCGTFNADLNYPDGTSVSPGETINKGWRLNNCGDTWWSGYQAHRIGGSFGPTSFNVPTVGPGNTGDLWAQITVPTTPGTHRATYRLYGRDGYFGEEFWVEINVNAPTNDCGRFQADLNYPDGSVVSPGETINKGWRLLNCGDTTWSGYTAVRTGGSFGPSSFTVPTTGPGNTADLYTNITVPTTNGRHRATYRLSGSNGHFGDSFWIEVEVRNGQPNPDYALLAPVSRGQNLVVSHGYNDPIPGEPCNVGGGGADHCDNQKYGLDLVPAAQAELEVLAPLPASVAWISGDCMGLRTRDNLNLNICHFSSFSVRTNDDVTRGAILGNRSTSWIHLSLDDRFRDPTRPPVPFNAEHTLEGISFDPGPDTERNQHAGVSFTSTNAALGSNGDCSDLLADVTYPDGTVVSPGETINKGWSLLNCGDTRWTGFTAIRTGGSFGPTSFTVPPTDPGSVADLYANISVPTSPGTHRATYQLSGPRGLFGEPFWVEIVVAGSGTDCSRFDAHAGFPDGTEVPPGETIEKGWLLTNCGDTVWSGYRALRVEGNFGPTSFGIALTNPGQQSLVQAIVTVPTEPGIHRATYQLEGPSGLFGDRFGIEVVIPDSANTFMNVTPRNLSINDDGWYAENPVDIYLAPSCPNGPLDCRGEIRLAIDSPGNEARFFITRRGMENSNVCTVAEDDLSSIYTVRSYEMTCDFLLLPGQSASYHWQLWIQPSTATVLNLSSSWNGVAPGVSETATVSIPNAAIRPFVLIHGILGSMPPQRRLITDQRASELVLDPFLGGYGPLLENAQKMGYEWDRTLFALAYDWRQSNAVSAGFLAKKLRDDIIPRSAPIAFVNGGRADLVVHSMGGLVSRAYVQGRAVDPDSGASLPYRNDVNKLVFIASPHKGFPFDYRTYEGMTWADYLYNTPPFAGGPLISFGMHAYIWPSLVEKHFNPSDDDLYESCTWVPYGQMPPVPVPYMLHIPGLRGIVPGVYICTREDITTWVQHPTRGVLSLFEMLPTEDFRPVYLVNEDMNPSDRMPQYPWGHDENTFLGDLNRNIDDLVSRLGLENIFTIYGEGAPETDQKYEVEPPGWAKTPPESWWVHGEVTDRTLREGRAGDDLIPTTSSSLEGLITLPESQKAALDASPAGSDGGARHKEIMFHSATQRIYVPRFLTGVEVPFESPHIPWLPPVSSLWSVVSACPVNLMVVDSLGRRLGYDSATGQVHREIPDAFYSGPEVEPQIMLIPNPEPGDFQITMTGYDEGIFRVRVDEIGPGGALPISQFAGQTTIGQVETQTVTRDDEPPPVATDDLYGLEQDQTLSVEAPGILENDVNLRGNPLLAFVVEDAEHGDLDFQSDGSFIYTPDAGFTGTDAFTYRVSNGFDESEIATVSVEVLPLNHEPEALEDRYQADGNDVLDVDAPGVLENDTDADGDELRAILNRDVEHGTLTLRQDGAFTYVPDSGFTGGDQFLYQASDGRHQSSPAAVLIEVKPPNELPVAMDDVYRFEAWEPIDVSPPGVLANDRDIDGDALTAVLVQDAEYGHVELSSDGSFVFVPDTDFKGTDRFLYRAYDGHEESAAAVVHIRPPMSCETLYGIDVEQDALVAIDPATGETQVVGSLGLRIANVGLDSDRRGRLWALSRDEIDSALLLLYTVDLETAEATVVQAFDTSFSPALVDSDIGLELGPDEKTLFMVSGSQLYSLDIDAGLIHPFPDAEPFGFHASSLTLPGRCRNFVSFDQDGYRLMRISPFDGTTEEIGPTNLDAPVSALASSPSGIVFGQARGTLYEFDLASGQALEVGPLGHNLNGLAFLPQYSRGFCLDRDVRRKTKLSRYVVEVDKKVQHIRSCGSKKRGHQQHEQKSCPDERPSKLKCGECGDKGFYRMTDRARLVFQTPTIPAPGTYRISFQVRAPTHKSARLRASVAGTDIRIEVNKRDWHWTQAVFVELSEGRNRINLHSRGRFDIEGVRVEKVCPELCDAEKKSACLDRKLAPGGLSRYVTELIGTAGHIRKDGCCGSKGFYYVAKGGTGRAGKIVAEIDVPNSGRYLFRFQYRVGDRKQTDESLRVSLGGRSFDFPDRKLENSRLWEWSPKLEVGLQEGRTRIEFLSIGRDSVHLERIRLERICECGGGR